MYVLPTAKLLCMCLSQNRGADKHTQSGKTLKTNLKGSNAVVVSLKHIHNFEETRQLPNKMPSRLSLSLNVPEEEEKGLHKSVSEAVTPTSPSDMIWAHVLPFSHLL